MYLCSCLFLICCLNLSCFLLPELKNINITIPISAVILRRIYRAYIEALTYLVLRDLPIAQSINHLLQAYC
jgi:hypothetical protein